MAVVDVDLKRTFFMGSVDGRGNSSWKSTLLGIENNGGEVELWM